jgi:ATP-binding cassette subfamily G (WHITE) protein 2 (SNQ2)
MSVEQVANRSVDSLPAAPDNSQPDDLPPPSAPPRFFGRASSRVTVGYFDRAGVDQLRRTLTHLSENRDGENAHTFSSETLSVPATGPFDFEKTLRNIMKKYVIAPTISIIRY